MLWNGSWRSEHCNWSIIRIWKTKHKLYRCSSKLNFNTCAVTTCNVWCFFRTFNTCFVTTSNIYSNTISNICLLKAFDVCFVATSNVYSTTIVFNNSQLPFSRSLLSMLPLNRNSSSTILIAREIICSLPRIVERTPGKAKQQCSKEDSKWNAVIIEKCTMPTEKKRWTFARMFIWRRWNILPSM